MSLTRKEWLANLKPGDEVCVDVPLHPRYITKVVRITETLIILRNKKFNRASGIEHYDKSVRFTQKSRINQVTDDVREEAEKIHILYKIKRIDFEELSILKLREILKLAEGEKGHES